MPTYNALGVTATLSVAPLEHTISESLNLRMGRFQRQEAQRIDQTLDDGRKLAERALTGGNSRRSTMQFLGEHEDMALFVVEAGDGIAQSTDDEGRTPSGGNPGEVSASIKSETEEYRVVIKDEEGDTEMPFNDDIGLVSVKPEPSSEASISPVRHRPVRPAMQQHPAPLARNDGQLALCLDVSYCTKTFLRDSGKKPPPGKDLKFEVFLNGELAEVAYEPSRHSNKPGFQRFTGTRFHRQGEKPWIYESSRLDMMTEASQSEVEERWDGIQIALSREAELRGTDWTNEPPISANFLAALAEIKLPEHIRVRGASLGVIDVIITAGIGRRYGPETTYRTSPARMDDVQYGKFAALGLADPPQEVKSPRPGPSTPVKQEPNMNLDHMPRLTPQMSNTIHTPTARTPHFQPVLESSELRMLLKTYENAHGQRRGERTLRQRVGDMTKMSPRKQQTTLAELGEELDEGMMQTIRRALNVQIDTAISPSLQRSMRLSPAMRIKPDPDAMDISPFTAVNVFPPSLTVDPNDLFLGPGPERPSPTSRIRRTKASALANSPISLPPKKHTPKKRKISNSSSPIRNRTNKRTATRWDPTELTAVQALEGFQIPAMCVGSSVGYARGLEQRQIAKIRGGEFKEEAFVVGMRFIVL